MVSRRRILSRSKDDLNMEYGGVEEEEDVWYQKEKLYKDHIQEVLEKWMQIDDEIWAKVICVERNRRVAKAYARAPVLTINGSDEGFDGYRIGVCGFENPMRDAQTEEIKRHIGHGVKIKMDDAGNILIKRVSKANVYVKDITTPEESSVSAEAMKLPHGQLEMEKPVKIFDMKKFQSNVNKELRRAYPDRRKLEFQCISAIAFVKNESDLLECPCWVMIINIVAMDMLKSKLPPVQRKSMDIRTKVKIPDEDPYSLPGSGSSSSSSSRDRKSSVLTDRPPKLPPRDAVPRYHVPKPDYEDQSQENIMNGSAPTNNTNATTNKYKFPHLLQSSRKKGALPDDPYYCGMRAHIPNFATRGKSKDRDSPPGAPQPPPNLVPGPHLRSGSVPPPEPIYGTTKKNGTAGYMVLPPHLGMLPPGHMRPTTLMRPESIYDSGLDSEWENFWDLEPR